MRVTTTILGAVLCLSMTTPAFAVFQFGNDLKAACEPSSPEHNEEQCLGYITGAFDALDLEQTAIQDGKVPDKHVCVPKGMTNVDVAKTVVSYIYDTPEELNLPAAALIANALVKGYPCPK